MKLTRSTLSGIVVERPEPTEAKPQGMCLDKDYDYDGVRDILHDFGFTAHIRPRGEEARAIKKRWRVTGQAEPGRLYRQRNLMLIMKSGCYIATVL